LSVKTRRVVEPALRHEEAADRKEDLDAGRAERMGIKRLVTPCEGEGMRNKHQRRGRKPEDVEVVLTAVDDVGQE